MRPLTRRERILVSIFVPIVPAFIFWQRTEDKVFAWILGLQAIYFAFNIFGIWKFLGLK